MDAVSKIWGVNVLTENLAEMFQLTCQQPIEFGSTQIRTTHVWSTHTFQDMTKEKFPENAFRHAIAAITQTQFKDVKIEKITALNPSGRKLSTSAAEVIFGVRAQSNSVEKQISDVLNALTQKEKHSSTVASLLTEFRKRILEDPSADAGIKENVGTFLVPANFNAQGVSLTYGTNHA